MQKLFPAEGETVPGLRFPEFRDAGEWEEKIMGDAATFINGRAYKQEELLDQGKYRVLRVGNFFSNKEWYYSDLELDEDKYCDDGDLLYAWSASFGPRIWRGEKTIYHYHIWKVREKKSIDKNFFFILLDYETERMKSQSSNGLGLLHITKSTIEGWLCKFPKIEEQQKIADCFSSIDKLITAQAQKVETIKAHKKGLMHGLFPSTDEVSV
jgi:type I restriction enzyme S subunit